MKMPDLGRIGCTNSCVWKYSVLFVSVLCFSVFNVHPVESFVLGRNGNEVKRKCLDPPLEDRENMADVVVTGTIRKTMPDFQHIGMYKGEVEIRRVVKGKAKVEKFVNGFEPTSKKEIIMVEGFGDTHICESDVRVKDTRILMLNMGEDGAMKLNSSIIRININNLERIDKAVNDIPYIPPEETLLSPCDGIFCEFHGICTVGIDNLPSCNCIDVCRTDINKVCGTNGITFNNECELKRHSCHKKTRVNIKNEGPCLADPCKEYKNCSYPSVCQLDRNRNPTCKCHEACPDTLDLVCGSDGKKYGNPCLLRREACLTNNPSLKVISRGNCAGLTMEPVDYQPVPNSESNPCRGITCPYGDCVIDRNNNPVCKCLPKCEPVVKPVCGSNGMNFDNECKLRQYACTNKIKDLGVLKEGNCDIGPCSRVRCPIKGQVCVEERNGATRCQCKSCLNEFKPVCGSNNRTYDSQCALDKENCERGTNIQQQHIGYCAGEGCGTVKECEYFSFCNGTGPDAACICPTNMSCEYTEAPVCGNDSKEYHNECFLRVASCKQKKTIYIKSHGQCDLCSGQVCRFGSHCVNGQCVCPRYCESGGDLVCASDGGRYRNRCEMRKAACEQKTTLYEDLCRDEPNVNPSETCRCNKYGSVALQCNPQRGYCDCKEGVGGAKCDRCMPKYWGLADLSFDGCRSCNCNEFGSRREDCRQNDGKCECKENIVGQQCDMCPDGKLVYFDVCGIDNELTRYNGRDCSEVTCHYGGYCAQEGSGVVCKCDSLECLQSNLGINGLEQCGNDSKTYRSNCHMQYQACKEQRPIARAYIGPCIDAVTPRMDQPINRPRKTTRHIVSKISDICYDDSYCIAEYSQCYLGTCQCLDGYIPSLDGEKCLEVKTAMPLETVENLTPCYNNPCRNGGTCELDESLGYRCLCPLGFTGPVCRDDVYITSPAFSGKSTLVVKEVRQPADDLMFQIAFLSYNKDGIILYASQYPNGTGDFVSVALNNGILEYKYDLGSGVAVIRSEHELATQVEHKVIVNRLGKKGFLKVNGDPIINAESPGSLTSLDLSGHIALGNLPDPAGRRIADRVGVTIGLAGCITMFQAGESNAPVYYNLAYPQFSGDIIGGRDMRQCGTNPCHSMPCKHGGNCLMADSEMFQCICRKGFSGDFCQRVLDPCLTYQCREGSTCQRSENGYPECVCPENMEGEFCEYERLKKIFVPQFIGSSFIEIPVGEIGSNSLSIRVWFLTSKSNGVIMYASQFPNGIGDYISLNIVNQKIEFKFNMGTSTVIIRSEEKIIQLNKWHEVLIQIIGRNGTLLIDNKDKWRYSGKSEGVLTELNLAGSSLYLGGFMNNYSIPYDSGIQHNLTGVIQRIYINGHQYDNLMETARDALGILEYKGPPCNVNPCLNGGICVPRLEEADCKCPTKYYGQRCEKKADSINRDLPVDFDGSTYLQYPNEVTTKQRAQRVNRYTIKFRTRSNGGLMLFQNGRSNILGDYLAISIVNGKVEFSYNLGKQTDQTLHILKSVVRVDDGKWHQIMASRDERAGILQVDNESLVSAESYMGATQLDTNGMLWIGGKTELPLGLPSEYYTGFTGCIKEVLIDNRKLHLFDHRNGQSSSTIKFCHL